ncbi:unnamed protein product [Paramecium sonneborni]|uniref:Zinc finger protein n=1 Tax=Paramecium sonneborni TaxID=65129 RepID=A0A8S1JZ23_9CILI|nr:unnamed protein product [Paramecium sonneborni]
MQSNDPKLGLLSNQQNSKYTNSQQEEGIFELQDFGDDLDQFAIDDARVQNKNVVLTNLNQEPIPMLKSSQSSNLRSGQSQQINQQNQLQQSTQSMQQVPQNQIQNSHQQFNQIQHHTLSAIQIVSDNSNQNSQVKIQDVNANNQMQTTCIFCLIPQMIPKNKNAFICYNCKQINKLVFAYFICGTCRITVMYQQGISNLINCTNCFTMNYVQQPNLPNTYQQSTFQNVQIQSSINQSQIINNQQQVSGSQQQQQQNQVSELEAEFKELTN